MSRTEEVGMVFGPASPEKISFIARETVRVREFLVAETEGGPVLYMVESFSNVSSILKAAMDYRTVEEARRASRLNPRDRIGEGVAKALGLIDELRKGRRICPTVPPEQGSSVVLAESRLLSEIYCHKGERWAEIGHLLRRPEVRVSVTINAIASRHLTVLAITGRGSRTSSPFWRRWWPRETGRWS